MSTPPPSPFATAPRKGAPAPFPFRKPATSRCRGPMPAPGSFRLNPTAPPSALSLPQPRPPPPQAARTHPSRPAGHVPFYLWDETVCGTGRCPPRTSTAALGPPRLHADRSPAPPRHAAVFCGRRMCPAPDPRGDAPSARSRPPRRARARPGPPHEREVVCTLLYCRYILRRAPLARGVVPPTGRRISRTGRPPRERGVVLGN